MHLAEIDKYADRHSMFHSWDPRVKIISLTFLVVSIASLSDIRPACLGFIIATSFVLLSGIPLVFILKRLRWVGLFVLFFLIVMPVTLGGNDITGFGFLTFSRQGLKLALLIALKAISICLLIFPMFGTARFHKSLKALQKIKLPDKLIQMIMFTYRYIFVFTGEAQRMLTAAKARLFRKKTNIFTLKTIGNLSGMLFIRGFNRTERVYNAMVSRGYRGSLETLDEFKLCKRDFVKALFTAILAVVLNLAG